MAATVIGVVDWGGGRTEEGHREYTVSIQVEALTTDGPQTVTFAPGLPAIGNPWTFGNDNDPWCFCTPFLKISPKVTEENNTFWLIEYRFTTRPQKRCATEAIGNPMLEPDEIGGTFVGGSIEATKDKDDNAIQTTSFETVSTQFAKNLPTVRISQNRLDLELDVFTPLVNTVNDAILWGLAPRKVRLDNVTWERRLYGICNFYYKKTYDFSIDPNTFDRDDIPNWGKKQIKGDWDSELGYVMREDADKDDARDYVKATDENENYIETFLLPDSGLPSSIPKYLDNVQYYPESNMLSLGIPSDLTA